MLAGFSELLGGFISEFGRFSIDDLDKVLEASFKGEFTSLHFAFIVWALSLCFVLFLMVVLPLTNLVLIYARDASYKSYETKQKQKKKTLMVDQRERALMDPQNEIETLRKQLKALELEMRNATSPKQEGVSTTSLES